jgi:3'-phosphoadenosine 5'-phosphosulfate sulfotransferase (PAPS reductase)/FAD synthetase
MNPFLIDEPTVISFSGGRTSAFMLYKVLEAHDMSLPEEAIVCFANTGKEDEATLQFVNDCAKAWNVKIHWLEYQPAELTKDRWKEVDFETASRDGEPFSALINKRSYLPNPVARFCTSDLKVIPIQKYMLSRGVEEFEQMLGIRADEKRRAAKLRQGNRTPLIDANFSQLDVQEFWKANSFDLGLKFQSGVTNLGNCDLCFLKGPNQVLSIIRDNPDRALWWAKQEHDIGGTFRSDRPSYSQMMKFATEQMDMFASTEEGIACFCGD